MKIKQTLSDNALLELLEHVQFIGTVAELIQIEFHNRMVDHRFKQAAINQHAKRIKESAVMIQTHLASLTYNKDREFFSYEYCLELHRMLKHFIKLDVEQVRTFMDGIEKIQKEADEKGETLTYEMTSVKDELETA